jgi:hypothetical protein
MVGQALWFEKFSNHFLDDDGRYPLTIHQYFCSGVLDGILIYDKTWAEHLQHIHQVLHTMQQHKLYVNLEKCSFGMDSVHYLAYIID